MRSHSEKDDPIPPPYMEEDGANQVHGVDESCPNNLTYRIEEAMEEDDDTANAKQVKEGDAESNASSLCGLTKGGGTPMVNPWNDEAIRSDQGKLVEGTTILPGSAELGEIVGGTTMEPIGTAPTARISLEEKISLMEKLENVEKTITNLELESKTDKERRKYNSHFAFLTEEIDRATSPATSTPSSTPSPDRQREGGIEGLGIDDSDMSDIIDSSVADTKEPEAKRGDTQKTLLDGKSKENG